MMLRQLPAILAVSLLASLAAAASAPEQQGSAVADAYSAAPRQLATDEEAVKGDSGTSIITTVGDAFKTQLREKTGQNINAFVALAVGLVLLVDGELVFKWILIVGAFIFAMLAAKNEVAAIWGLDYHNFLSHIIGFEAGLGAAYATFLGIEGIMVGIGAFLGMIVSHWIRTLLVNFGVHAPKEVIFGIYTVCVLGGIFIMGRKKYMRALAFVAPFAGGALVSSAVSFFATLLDPNGGSMDFLYQIFPSVLAPVGGPWIDFFLLLCNNGSKDVGLFANSGKGTTVLLNEPICLDRLVGIGFWLVLFALGALRQTGAVKRNEMIANSDLKVGFLKDSV